MARPFVWTPEKEQAAQLEWEGRLTQAAIAAQLGTTRRTIEGWTRRPAFRQRMKELAAASWDASAARWRATHPARRKNATQHTFIAAPSPGDRYNH